MKRILIALFLFLGAMTLWGPTGARADPLGVSVEGRCDGSVTVWLTNQGYWAKDGNTLTVFVTYPDGSQDTREFPITTAGQYDFTFYVPQDGSNVWVGVVEFGGHWLSCGYTPPTEVPPTEVPPTPTPVPPTPDLEVSVEGRCDGSVTVWLTNQGYWAKDGNTLTVFVTYPDGSQDTREFPITTAGQYDFTFYVPQDGSNVWVGVAEFGGHWLSCGKNPQPAPTSGPPEKTPKPGKGGVKVTQLPNTGSGEDDGDGATLGGLLALIVIIGYAGFGPFRRYFKRRRE